MNALIVFLLTLIVNSTYPNLDRGEMTLSDDLKNISVQDVRLQISLNTHERSDYIDREVNRFHYPLQDTEVLSGGKYYIVNNRHTYFNNKYVIDFFLNDTETYLLQNIENKIKELNLDE